MATRRNQPSQPKAAGPANRGLEITTKREGFRRAGIAHEGTKVHPFDKLDPDQVEQLKNEPMLVVREVDIEPDADEGKADKT